MKLTNAEKIVEINLDDFCNFICRLYGTHGVN